HCLGIPLDEPRLQAIQRSHDRIVRGLIDEVNPTFGVYEGTTFKADRMEQLVARHNLDWPRRASGCLSMQKRDWERMVERYPFLKPLHLARRWISLLRTNALTTGPDGRSRFTFFPFMSDTGRNAWKAKEFIFALPSFLRGLIQPEPGRALAYLDYG